MKKVFIIGLSCFLFASCGKMEERPASVTNVKSPSTVYNECITGTMQNIELYHKYTTEQLVDSCKKRADKVKNLSEAFGQYN